MRINHIKSPKGDTIRGIGKLGWTESGRLNSTIKRLTSTFNNDVDTPAKSSKKTTVICPVCNRKFNINNPDRIPDHTTKRWYKSNPKICSGSWSQQLSGETRTINEENINSAQGVLRIFDKMLIDFSRSILQPFDSHHKDVFETTLLKIERIENLRNNGEVYSWREFLYFSDVEKPIPNNISIVNHMIKISL